MKIVIDDKIPYIRGVFDHHADVFYLPPCEITPAAVATADALIIRTRTRCDATLLRDSKVRLIATATIGFDHIDTHYCHTHAIEVATAAGCNARAVAQWVFAALRHTGPNQGTIGVIGVGNVGTQVCAMAEQYDYNTLKCDPPRAAAEGHNQFVTLGHLLENSDIVTLHVPLNDLTREMADTLFFEKIKRGATFINSSRGEVVHQPTLLAAILNGTLSHVALDVWANEPNIDPNLLHATNIATPHIAGYSARGKAQGTQMVVRTVAKHFNIKELLNWSPNITCTPENPEDYNIIADDAQLRANPSLFETLRSKYKYR